MITRIELANFMSHEHTVIEPAAGLTVLIGPNNCGKSAVIAALQILASNENSTYVMRHGARECSVKVETDDGHAIQWRRKNAPSYVVDGQVFDRLRGSGLPNELNAALRLPKVEAGDNTDFDVHFGTQKSPIFLLGGSAANAARFFASSSDAIRLVEMQKRHKVKLADTQKEKGRLEAESKQVNAALRILEPVVDIEKRLAATREVYDELQRVAAWILTAESHEVGLRTHEALVGKYSAYAGLLHTVSPPPAIMPIGPLQNLIDATVVAKGRSRAAEARAYAMRLLPHPPSLTPTEPLQALIRAVQFEQARQAAFGSHSRVLASLQSPPTLSDDSALERHLIGIQRSTQRHDCAAAKAMALSRVPPPPLMTELEPLDRLVQRVASSASELAAKNRTGKLLGCLREPPPVADEAGLASTLAAIRRATRVLARWEEASAAAAAVVPAPTVVDTSAIADIIGQLAKCAAHFNACDSALQNATSNLAQATEDLRSKAEGGVCPICGNAMDADTLIARAAVGLGGHDHG